MTTISFKTAIPGGLPSEFISGFTGISIAKAIHGRPIEICLWRSDDSGLKVRSVMHDLAERFEVGALEFSRADHKPEQASTVELPDEFRGDVKTAKLVLSEEGNTVESGIVIEGTHGTRIVIVAGAYPYTIAIDAPFISEPFDPEYALPRYQLMSLK